MILSIDRFAYDSIDHLMADTLPIRKKVDAICSLDVPIEVRLQFQMDKRCIGEACTGLLTAILKKRNFNSDISIWYIRSAQWHMQLHREFAHLSSKDQETRLESEFLQNTYIEEAFVRENPHYLCQLETLTFRVYFPTHKMVLQIIQATASNPQPLKFRWVLTLTSNMVPSFESLDTSPPLLKYIYEISIPLNSLLTDLNSPQEVEKI
jgi:hypothetical protein